MAELHKSDFQNPLLAWIDSRLPLPSLMYKEYAAFPTPKNFNYFWNFGALAMVIMVIMIATGVLLAMNYQPNVGLAFELGAAHHAGRELRLAVALHARERRIDVLYRDVHPHPAGHVLRLV